MQDNDYRIAVALYLYGDELEPATFSARLGVSPSDSHCKGDRFIIPTGREIIRKTGFWALRETSDSLDTSTISGHINSLCSQVGTSATSILDLEGVQSAHLDVFIATRTNESGHGEVAFELSQENIDAMKQLGVPVRFTVATGPK